MKAKNDKFNLSNLNMPNNIEMVKNDEGVQELVEKAIKTIHKKEEIKPVGKIRKFTFDIPDDIFKEAKHYIVEAEISMKDYIVSLMANDLMGKGRLKKM